MLRALIKSAQKQQHTHHISCNRALRLIVDDVEAAKEALRDAGAAFVVVPVLAVEIADRPGKLARVAHVLANAQINIEYVYATTWTGAEKSAGIFRVSGHDPAMALEFSD